MPIGAIIAFPGEWAATDLSSVSDWLLCDGGVFDEGVYPALGAALGFAPGDTMNVPQLCIALGETDGIHIEGFTGEDPALSTGNFPVIAGTSGPPQAHSHEVPEHNHITQNAVSSSTSYPLSVDETAVVQNARYVNFDTTPSQLDWVPDPMNSLSGGGIPTGGHLHYDQTGATGGGDVNEMAGHNHETKFDAASNAWGTATNALKGSSGSATRTSEYSAVGYTGHYHLGDTGSKAAFDTEDNTAGTGYTRPKSVQMNWLIRGL